MARRVSPGGGSWVHVALWLVVFAIAVAAWDVWNHILNGGLAR